MSSREAESFLLRAITLNLKRTPLQRLRAFRRNGFTAFLTAHGFVLSVFWNDLLLSALRALARQRLAGRVRDDPRKNQVHDFYCVLP